MPNPPLRADFLLLSRLTLALWLALFFARLHPAAFISDARAAPPSLSHAEQQRAAALQRAQADQQRAAIAARREAAAQRRADALTQQEITLNAALRATEDHTARITARLAALDQAMTQADATRAHDAASIRPLIPVMLRLALHPTASLLGSGRDLGSAVQGALVMRGLTREINQRATALRAVIAQDRALRAQVATQQAALQTAIASQKAARDQLQTAITAAQTAQQAASEIQARARRAAAAHAAQARSLGGLIARLQAAQRRAAARAAAARIKPFTSNNNAPNRNTPNKNTPGDLRGAPVAGRLVRQFGDQTMAGPALGDTFATAPAAMVSASCAGRVAFARRFQSYGKLMILSCSDGNDFVIAGVHRFIVHVGQKIVPGQPIAAMAAHGNEGANAPKLYVELRHDGKPVNPALGFAGSY
jgi:septal ring factor EnvC (AmiA/AmiB activator)